MKFGLPGGFQGHNQRSPFFQMIFQIAPLAAKGESPVARLIQVALEVGGVNSMGFAGIKRLLDLLRSGSCGMTLLALPVLQDHRNTGSAAAVLLLLHKRDVQPDTRRTRSEQSATEVQ